MDAEDVPAGVDASEDVGKDGAVPQLGASPHEGRPHAGAALLDAPDVPEDDADVVEAGMDGVTHNGTLMVDAVDVPVLDAVPMETVTDGAHP